MKVERWGNELAIRLSAEVVGLMNLKEGDEIDIRVAGTDTFDIERTQGAERMLVPAQVPRASPQGLQVRQA